MGQKVHPTGIRLGIIKDWTSTWYADTKDYADYLHTDMEVRTYLRKVEEAIAGGNHDTAVAALKAAEPEIARSAQKGIVHANVAARKVSRLNHRVKALKA